MSGVQWLAWVGPALDVAVLAGLAATWWQLRRDPGAAWRDYEARLRELQEGLRLLVVQAEGEARDLDRRLAARAEQLEALADEANAAGVLRGPAGLAPLPVAPLASAAASSGAKSPAAAAPPRDAAGPSLAERVQQLAAAQTPIAEIARRLSLPVAEARVLAGLTTGALGYAAPPAAPGARPGAAAASSRGAGTELGS